MGAPSTLGAAGVRVLVTGAGGFIGSNLVRRLAGLGASVTATSRRPGRLDEFATGYRFTACDLRSLPQTRELVESAQPQLVFHLAAQPDSNENGNHLHAVVSHNVSATANLLDSLAELPGVALVYGDSAKVYGNSGVPFRGEQRLEPLSSYAVSKQAAWGMIDVYRRVHGIQAVGLRPTLVYGPGQGFNLFTFLIAAIDGGRDEIALDGGVQTRDPLFIDDAVNAFIAAAMHCGVLNGRNLPIGGGREISVDDIARLTVRLLGGQQRVIARPTSVRPTETQRSWCDNAEITQAIGWLPRTPLEVGIQQTAAAQRVTVESVTDRKEKV